jgi:hypothetical protein
VPSDSALPRAGDKAASRWTVAFFSVMALVIVVLVIKAQQRFLPAVLARQFGHNSEVFALAILVVAAVLARRRQPPAPPAWHVVVAGALLALGLLVLYGPVPATVKTLNEPIFAGSLLWLYVLIPRPLPRAWLISPVLVVVVAVGYHTALITAQAESIVALVLAPLALDVADRRLLEPRAQDRPVLRWLMIAFLLLFPVLMIAVKGDLATGALAEAVKYCSRGTEGFWGLAVVLLYFVVAIRLRSRAAARPDSLGLDVAR